MMADDTPSLNVPPEKLNALKELIDKGQLPLGQMQAYQELVRNKLLPPDENIDLQIRREAVIAGMEQASTPFAGASPEETKAAYKGVGVGVENTAAGIAQTTLQALKWAGAISPETVQNFTKWQNEFLTGARALGNADPKQAEKIKTAESVGEGIGEFWTYVAGGQAAGLAKIPRFFGAMGRWLTEGSGFVRSGIKGAATGAAIGGTGFDPTSGEEDRLAAAGIGALVGGSVTAAGKLAINTGARIANAKMLREFTNTVQDYGKNITETAKDLQNAWLARSQQVSARQKELYNIRNRLGDQTFGGGIAPNGMIDDLIALRDRASEELKPGNAATRLIDSELRRFGRPITTTQSESEVTSAGGAELRRTSEVQSSRKEITPGRFQRNTYSISEQEGTRTARTESTSSTQKRITYTPQNTPYRTFQHSSDSLGTEIEMSKGSQYISTQETAFMTEAKKIVDAYVDKLHTGAPWALTRAAKEADEYTANVVTNYRQKYLSKVRSPDSTSKDITDQILSKIVGKGADPEAAKVIFDSMPLTGRRATQSMIIQKGLDEAMVGKSGVIDPASLHDYFVRNSESIQPFFRNSPQVIKGVENLINEAARISGGTTPLKAHYVGYGRMAYEGTEAIRGNIGRAIASTSTHGALVALLGSFAKVLRSQAGFNFLAASSKFTPGTPMSLRALNEFLRRGGTAGGIMAQYSFTPEPDEE